MHHQGVHREGAREAEQVLGAGENTEPTECAKKPQEDGVAQRVKRTRLEQIAVMQVRERVPVEGQRGTVRPPRDAA